MKILIATPLFPPEISMQAEYVYTLAERLKTKHDVTIVTYANHTEKIEGVQIRNIAKNKPLPVRLYHYTRTLIRLAEKADIIYAQRTVASGLPAIIAGKHTKTPIVVNYIEDEAWERFLGTDEPPIHQSAFRKQKKIPGSIWGVWHVQQFVLRHTSKLLVPSKFVRDELVHTYALQKENVLVLPLPKEKELILPFEVTKKGGQIFMDTSLYSWGDIPTALRALKKVLEKYTEAHLSIIGDGPEKKYLQKISTELGLNEHVTFFGEVSKAEKQHVLQSSDVYLSTASYAENPRSLFEAFQNSVPVIVPDVPGIREGVEHEKTGLLTQPGNANITTEMLCAIFESKELATQITQNAKNMLEERYSWEAHVDSLENIFNNTHHE